MVALQLGCTLSLGCCFGFGLSFSTFCLMCKIILDNTVPWAHKNAVVQLNEAGPSLRGMSGPLACCLDATLLLSDVLPCLCQIIIHLHLIKHLLQVRRERFTGSKQWLPVLQTACLITVLTIQHNSGLLEPWGCGAGWWLQLPAARGLDILANIRKLQGFGDHLNLHELDSS